MSSKNISFTVDILHYTLKNAELREELEIGRHRINNQGQIDHGIYKVFFETEISKI